MSNLKVGYSFDALSVMSDGNRYPLQFTGANVVNGPNQTPMGDLPKAVDLGSSGKGSVSLAGMAPDKASFTIRIAFKANGSVSSRQNLVESDMLAFSIFLDKGSDANKFVLNASVGNNVYGWGGPSTLFRKVLKPSSWYTITLAYDDDTAALFVGDEIIGVHAFPKGKLKSMRGSKLYFGTWVDGSKYHFKGCLAGFQWYDDVPNDLQGAIDDKRSQAEWYITRKYESVTKAGLNLGKPAADIKLETSGAHIQHYAHGAIMYHDSMGAAFAMHGAIYSFYRQWSRRTALGFLISDELEAANTVGRKSLFSKGGIYWTGGTGAVPVLGQMYVDYEAQGESRWIGFPTKIASNISGGSRQLFQGAELYHRNGQPHAFEVHGDILTRYKSSGGSAKWGFPVSNETDVKKGSTVVGKVSEFEGCTIYWRSSTGAFEVHGDIRKKYTEELKGPLGELGFPTSNEINIPGVSGAGKMNTFEKGSILWYGSYSSIIVAFPFKIHLGRLATKENEGWLMGQNDLYVRIWANENGAQVHYKRKPNSGDMGGHNIRDLNYKIPKVFTPNKPNYNVWYQIKVWDADPGNDDYLGAWSKTLNAANGWGMRDNNGIFNSGKVSKINSFQSSVQPQIDFSKLSEPQKFWGFSNRSTAHISWTQHASAFRDVDSQTEWWDITDWIDKAFYELVTEDIASGGNCFGMSLESIYARKFKSLFGLPLDGYTWNQAKNEINIKHCYQAGAEAVYWFLGQFLSGNTHDPKDVFNRSRSAFNTGRHPVLCVAQNSDFSGAPHCILPVHWDSSSKPWKIAICDPNYPGSTKELTVNPDNNTFNYLNKYTGGEWTGGRLHYMPWNVLGRQPRTPTWDLILLILTGTVILLADSSETTAVVDENGNDLSAFGSQATALLKDGDPPYDYLFGFKGFDKPARSGPGNILLRREIETKASGSVARTTGRISRDTVSTILRHRGMRAVASDLRSAGLSSALGGRTAHFVAADPALMGGLTASARAAFTALVKANSGRNFIHKTRAVSNGTFAYAFKHQFNEVKIESSQSTGHSCEIGWRDVGTSTNTMMLKPDRNKNAQVVVNSKLGAKGDRISMKFENMPIGANKPLDLNVRPGLGDLELTTPGAAVTVRLQVDAIVDGVSITRSFNLPVDKGARIKTSSLLDKNELHFAKIDTIFGAVLGKGKVMGN